MRNRFKGLDLIDRVPDELWETGIKPSPRKRNAKRQNVRPEEALRIAEKRREAKANEKRKDIPI